jgi:hypothetical protein
MTDESEVLEEEEDGDEYVPQPAQIVDGDCYIPDPEMLASALEAHGVVPLAYQHRDGQLFVLIASQAGFKWTDIESFGMKPERRLRPVQ